MLSPIEICAKFVAKYTALGYHVGMSCQPSGYIGVSIHLFNRKALVTTPGIICSLYYTWDEDEAELTRLSGAQSNAA